MNDLDLLFIFRKRETYEKYAHFVQEHSVPKEVFQIIKDIGAYFITDVARIEVEWNSFATWFKHKQHPTMKSELIAIYEKIFSNLIAVVSSPVEKELIECYIEKDYLTRIADISLRGAEGSKVTSINDVQGLCDEYNTVIGSVLEAEKYLVTEDIHGLLSHVRGKGGLNWRLNELNKALGPLRKGDFITLTARPDCISGSARVRVVRGKRCYDAHRSSRVYSMRNLERVQKNNPLPMWIMCLNEETKELSYEEIDNLWSSGKKDTISIQAGSNVLECTEDHLVYTQSGWKKAGSLIVNTDYILVRDYSNQNKTKLERVVSITNTGEKECFDISMKGSNKNFLVEDCIVHNCGKTTMLAAESTFMANQLLKEQTVLWFNNEEEGKKVKFRIIQAAIGWTSAAIEANPVKAYNLYEKEVGTLKKILIYDRPAFSYRDVHAVLKDYNPGLIIFDQLRKVKGFEKEGGNDVGRLQLLFQQAREWAKEFAPVINVHQARGDAEGQKWIELNQMHGSQTDIQGEVDAVIALGRSHEPGFEKSRFLYMPKNKMAGGPTSDEKYRNGKFEVEIQPEIARFKGVL